MAAQKSQRRAQMKGTEEEIGTYAGLPGQIVISYQSGWRPYVMTGETGGAVPVALKSDVTELGSTLSGSIATKQDAGNAVTLDGAQTITGAKTFSTQLNVNGGLTATGIIKAGSFAADNGQNKNIDFCAPDGSWWSLVEGSHPANSWAAILTNYGDQSCTGTMRAATFQATSDVRKKTGLAPVHPDLSSLTAYRYTLKDDDKTHVGLVAQEVEKVIPEAVAEDKEDFLALDYNAVVASLVDEVNRLRKRVEALEAAA